MSSKRVILLIVGILILVSLIVLFWGWMGLGGYMLFERSPMPPSIVKANINFMLEYSYNGDTFVFNDALICEYDGYEFVGGLGKVRRWNAYFEKTPSDRYFTIFHHINDTYALAIGIELPEYYMSDPNYLKSGVRVLSDPNIPRIRVKNIKTNKFVAQEVENAVLADGGFMIIDWYCDPPIDNSFE